MPAYASLKKVRCDNMTKFITTDTHLAAALISFDQDMTFSREGKTVYFQFDDSAIVRELVKKYEDETLGNGMIQKHEDAMYRVQQVLKGKV